MPFLSSMDIADEIVSSSSISFYTEYALTISEKLGVLISSHRVLSPTLPIAESVF